MQSQQTTRRGIQASNTDPLQGGGEMGALMRSIDWAATPVGPVEGWPQSLRTSLSILLSSQHPIFIWWGKDLVQFYNDGYRPILGSKKHPVAMGQRGRECWKEIWPVIEPMIETVFDGGSTYIKDGLLPLDRHGFIEECYFNYAYSPIRDEVAGVAGVFVACSETTGRVIGERRLETLGELGAVGARSAAQGAEGACQAAARVLGEAPADVPFSLVYLVEQGSTFARLVSFSGIDASHPAALPRVTLNDAQALWPLDARQVEPLDVALDVPGRMEASRPFPGGLWPEPATRAVVQPLLRTGEPAPYGFLVTGISARLVLDEGYRSFLRLAAGHLTTAISNARAHAEERRRAEALAELDRAKTAFFSNVSHEFRTPLTLMLGPTEEALASEDRALRGTALEQVHRNELRLLKLVNALLDFSRMESGRGQARYQPLDLAALTTGIVSSFQSLIESSGLTLTVDVAPLPEPVFVDRVLWEKVVLNLLSNAFKFTLQGGIRVSLEVQDGSAVLGVEDTGTGIEAKELPHVFERFHRVEGARGRSHEGSGIGLALVQEAVRMHGGAVTAESRVGEGSRFTVSIPLGASHLPPERIASASSEAPHAEAAPLYLSEAFGWVRELDTDAVPPQDPLHAVAALDEDVPAGRVGAHVLVADDNADMRDYIRRILCARGMTVEALADGETALQRARARVPDLVLTDVMMPGRDGMQLLEALKRDEATRMVPVILLSARAGEAASARGMERGADDYVLKPFAAKDLVSRIEARLEAARRRAEAERARARLHEQFMQAPVAICVLRGRELIYELANPMYLELVGRQNVVGKPVREAFPELEGDLIFSILEGVFATGVPFMADEYHFALDRSGSSGGGAREDVYLKFTIQPVRGDDGAVADLMVVAVDVTPLVQARQQSEALTEKLKLADQRKDEFLAMLAHELRNPMAAISMALSLWERSEGRPALAAKHRDMARRQMRNLVRLVDDLLDVSRITRGKVELRKTEGVDLAGIVQNALTATRAAIEERHHAVSVTLSSGSFRVDADTTRMEQVVVNLLTNAARYTDPGGQIWVELSQEEVGGEANAVLRVRDNGRGIPPNMLDQVFDLFVQVAPTMDRSTGGLGLGLTLVRRLVEMHGGSVCVRSDGADKGSEFVVRLPISSRAKSSPAAVNVVEEERPAQAAARRRILLIEDSEDLRMLLQDFLEELGHEVLIAKDGLEGTQRLLELCPDVALVDVGLPGIDGYEVARRVRARPGGEKLFLVALTGYGGADARAKARSAGFDLHLTKPVNIEELPDVVSRTGRYAS